MTGIRPGTQRTWRFLATLIIAAATVAWVAPARAQQTGPTVYVCDSETVDSNYYNDYVEQTVCLSGSASGLDSYNEVDLQQYQQNVYIAAVGADVQIYGPSGLVSDSGEQQGYSVSVSGWAASPQIGQWYTLDGLYDECDDPSDNGNANGCNWTGLMQGDSVSAMLTTAPTPTLSVSTSGTPTTYNQAVTFTATISNGPSYGTLTFYDGSSVLGTAPISGTTSSITASTLAPGSHSITAVWPGNVDYNAASSGPITQTINQPAGLIYGYFMGGSNLASGYAANGDLLSYIDTVNGTWNSGGYDNVDRLVATTQAPVSGPQLSYCWSYDAFGNRLQQETSNVPFSANGATCSTGGTVYQNAWAQYNTLNQISQTAAWGGALTPSYDAAGNLGWDGANSFLYDAEGHICVAGTQSGWYGYLYDAEGNRVAKGTVTGWSCDTTANGFTPTEWYILGQNGEQVTEADGSGNWQHTNAYADGQLIGTYDQAGLHFQLSDWEGTRRVETDYAGNPQQICTNAPFGDSSATCATPTEQFYTGQEEDTETGDDHFPARYYIPTVGLWATPDPSDGSYDIDNPQSFNRYVYVDDEPLTSTDPTGLAGAGWGTGVGGGACKGFGLTYGAYGFNPCSPLASAVAVGLKAISQHATYFSNLTGISTSFLKDVGKVAPYIGAAFTVICSALPSSQGKTDACGPSGWTALLPKNLATFGTVASDTISVVGAYLCASGGPFSPGCVGFAVYTILNDLFAEIWHIWFTPAKFHGSMQPRPGVPDSQGTSSFGVPIRNLEIPGLQDSGTEIQSFGMRDHSLVQ